jgi:hypothetical protein
MMLWRTKNGKDVFTGIVMRNDGKCTIWSHLEQPNFYKLVDAEDIDGDARLITPPEFMREMQQYDRPLKA